MLWMEQQHEVKACGYSDSHDKDDKTVITALLLNINYRLGGGRGEGLWVTHFAETDWLIVFVLLPYITEYCLV